jgi:hypothetical protein
VRADKARGRRETFVGRCMCLAAAAAAASLISKSDIAISPLSPREIISHFDSRSLAHAAADGVFRLRTTALNWGRGKVWVAAPREIDAGRTGGRQARVHKTKSFVLHQGKWNFNPLERIN